MSEEEIEVGEYIRTKGGSIRKVGEIDRCQECNKKIYISVDIINGLYFESSWHLKEIVSHSKNIIDLIEVGDIVKIKNLKGDFIVSTCYHVFDITSNNILIENINNKEIELISILTHEQYEQNCYKVGDIE